MMGFAKVARENPNACYSNCHQDNQPLAESQAQVMCLVQHDVQKCRVLNCPDHLLLLSLCRNKCGKQEAYLGHKETGVNCCCIHIQFLLFLFHSFSLCHSAFCFPLYYFKYSKFARLVFATFVLHASSLLLSS